IEIVGGGRPLSHRRREIGRLLGDLDETRRPAIAGNSVDPLRIHLREHVGVIGIRPAIIVSVVPERRPSRPGGIGVHIIQIAIGDSAESFSIYTRGLVLSAAAPRLEQTALATVFEVPSLPAPGGKGGTPRLGS